MTVVPPTAASAPVAAARAIDVVKVYGADEAAVRALDKVSVNLQAERFTAVIGPPGAGTSTFVRCLAGLEGVTAGTIQLGDTELTALDDDARTRLCRDELGFLLQSADLDPALSTIENITRPLDAAGRDYDEQWLARVVNTMRLLDLLEHQPAELSAAQQQRVAAARALAGAPRILFADEPTGNLDARAGMEVLDMLRRAVEDLGQTIVMATHDPVAASYANRVLFMARGRLVSQLFEPRATQVVDHLAALGIG